MSVIRYLVKTRKRTGGFECLRCKGRFAGRDAYDRHLVRYRTEDWCHLPEEVGLVPGRGGWYRLSNKTPHRAQGLQIGTAAA